MLLISYHSKVPLRCGILHFSLRLSSVTLHLSTEVIWPLTCAERAPLLVFSQHSISIQDTHLLEEAISGHFLNLKLRALILAEFSGVLLRCLFPLRMHPLHPLIIGEKSAPIWTYHLMRKPHSTEQGRLLTEERSRTRQVFLRFGQNSAPSHTHLDYVAPVGQFQRRWHIQNRPDSQLARQLPLWTQMIASTWWDLVLEAI